VIDIGSNDGSLLRPFKDAGHRVLGIDPATEIARQATTAGIETIPELMSIELAKQIRDKHGPAQIVCMFNAFAHADNMGEIAESIRTMLAPDGLFFFEAQYLLDIIDRVLIATIFHEHMSHHSVKALTVFLGRHGMELVDVERVPIQHGSLIGTVQIKGGKYAVRESVRNSSIWKRGGDSTNWKRSENSAPKCTRRSYAPENSRKIGRKPISPSPVTAQRAAGRP
jgi:predicted TPR repeat methyltransferase